MLLTNQQMVFRKLQKATENLNKLTMELQSLSEQFKKSGLKNNNILHKPAVRKQLK